MKRRVGNGTFYREFCMDIDRHCVDIGLRAGAGEISEHGLGAAWLNAGNGLKS